MAKRYFSFQDLSASEGYFKPSGTMGRHHAMVVHQGNLTVVVGSVEGRVTLKPGDTLGYDVGTVWLVPSADSYRDPIRRVLALAHVPQKALSYSLETVEYTVSYGRSIRGSAADPSTGESVRVFGEHSDRELPETLYQGLDKGEYQGGFSCNHRVVGGDVVVVYSVSSFDTTLSRDRRATRVIVRPWANKAEVVGWLKNLFGVAS